MDEISDYYGRHKEDLESRKECQDCFIRFTLKDIKKNGKNGYMLIKALRHCMECFYRIKSISKKCRRIK